MEQKQEKGEDSKHCSPVRKPGPVTMDHVLLALQEPEEDRDLRLHNLFNSFDKLNLGYLDHAQIEAGLSALHIPSEYKHARDLLDVCDANKDGRVDYSEFRCYMDAKELELYRIFQDVDVQHSGCISPEELSDALVEAGIEINDEELAHFVEHVDEDNNGVITFEEWRNFLLLYPHEVTIKNIYYYYERVCLVDIGEQATLPEGISKHGNATKYLLAGGVAGAVSRTATAPIDRLKVKLQIQTKQARMIPAIKEIWNEGKFLAFFRGNGLNAMKVAPESAIKFYAIEMLKTYIMDAKGEDKAEIGGLDRLVAGGLGGAIAQTAIYPMELVKTRLQTYDCKGGKPPNLGALARDIWVKEGPRAFYRGTIPSLLGIIPYAGIDRAGYETLTDMSKKYILHENEEPGLLLPFWCGTISSAVGATCVYPLQVVRTRMQVNFSKQGASMSDVFWKTFHEGGLYKGLFPSLLKVVPAAGISYLVFEAMKKHLQLE